MSYCEEHKKHYTASCPYCNMRDIAEQQRPKLAEVKPIYESNFRNPVATLRRIADQIEAGEYGEVSDVALVLRGETVEAFHSGEGRALEAYLLFELGKRRIEDAVLSA